MRKLTMLGIIGGADRVRDPHALVGPRARFASPMKTPTGGVFGGG